MIVVFCYGDGYGRPKMEMIFIPRWRRQVEREMWMMWVKSEKKVRWRYFNRKPV